MMTKKGVTTFERNPLILLLVRPAGFEPAAYGFEGSLTHRGYRKKSFIFSI